MAGSGSSVTLILYQIGDKWWKEPTLNLVAAAAQWSSYTHIEVAIGEVAGDGGQMGNVLRVFNDAVGVVSHSPERLSTTSPFLILR